MHFLKMAAKSTEEISFCYFKNDSLFPMSKETSEISNHCSSQKRSNINHLQSSEENIYTIVLPQDQNTQKESYLNKMDNKTNKSLQKNESRIVSIQEEENITLPFSTGWIGIFILLFSAALSLIVTLWPQHNSILDSKYWYEGLGVWTFGHSLMFSVSVAFERNRIVGMSCMVSWKTTIQCFLSLGTGYVIIFATIYLIWTAALRQCPPMPHIGVVSYVLHGLFLWPIAFWFLFPSDMRNMGSQSQIRILWFITLMMLRSLMAASYTQVTLLFLIEPEYIGPRELLSVYLGIFLPLLKIFNTWWLKKLYLNVFENENDFVNYGSIIVVGYLHSFSTSLLLGSSEISGSTYTKYFLMFSDCILNTKTFLNILKLHKSISIPEMRLKDKTLKCLALKEFLKILVPAVYCLSFIIAYYGPNAHLIGNVKNEYWQFEKVTNLAKKFQNIIIVFVIDVCRGIVFGLILWHCCKLNMFSAYCYIVRYYGVFILFFGSAVINGVNVYLIVM